MQTIFFKINRSFLKGFLPVIPAVLMGMGCSSDKTDIIREKVAERVVAFRIKEQSKCRDGLLADAGHIVDSLLLTEAMADVSDSLSRLRPFKPVKPQPVPPIDSLRVKPIFNR